MFDCGIEVSILGRAQKTFQKVWAYRMCLPKAMLTYRDIMHITFTIGSTADMNTLRPLLDRWKDVVVMFMLRLTIAPCVESIILLDRLCYLKEHGMCYCVSVCVYTCIHTQVC